MNNDIRVKVDELALEVGEYVADEDLSIMWSSRWYLRWVGLHSEAGAVQLGLGHPLPIGTQKNLSGKLSCK